MPGKATDRGVTGRNNRRFVEAVLWVARTGSPWRDLPDAFGPWYTVYTRFWRWSRHGVWKQVFKALADDPDFEYRFVEAVLWVARTGSPWRDLPDAFGPWYTVYTRFWRWSRHGVWKQVFKALADDPDFEYLIIDTTIVRAHHHAAGAKGGLKIRPSDARAAG